LGKMCDRLFGDLRDRLFGDLCDGLRPATLRRDTDKFVGVKHSGDNS
jgi:hypothetical protein